MVVEKNVVLFRTLRVILDDVALAKALREKKYAYITGLSYDGSFANNDPSITKKSKQTVIIEPSEMTDEEIIASFRDTTRNEVRRTFTMPELSFVLPDSNRKGVLGLYSEFEEMGDRPARKAEYFRESLFAGAYWKGKLIASIICYDAKPVLRINAIVSVRKDGGEESKYVSFATRRLVFELIEYARNHGYRRLDLGGINTTDESKKGITAFKMSFGGVTKEEYTYTYKNSLFRYVTSLFYKRR
ncbi:MAG: peptidoglycan bridge formation glycyltransferase FemA/FemB family protein [Candidatus Ryanbacteria bacterium]|nr:peptidoglycan bridge formation glycyltransferase FemA/FemB family protein [Candidatus Ryanbacteria bacterium]